MQKTKILILTCLLLVASVSLAQKKPKFGKIDPSELALMECPFDSGASAMILGDYGNGEFDIKSNGFVFVLHHHRIIKVFSKDGLAESNISIPYYVSKKGLAERVDGIKAVCHCLEDGVVKSTELISKDIYKNKVGFGTEEVKFAIPGVRVGCIIEYKYDLVSPFLVSLRPWRFQQQIPVRNSEMEMVLPEEFVFQNLLLGDRSLNGNENDVVNRNYSGVIQNGLEASYNVSFASNAKRSKWTMKDIPAFREEPYSGSIWQHGSQMENQLLKIIVPGRMNQTITPSYEEFNSDLIKDDNFGGIAKPGAFEKKLANDITAGITGSTEQTKAILAHIQQKIVWDKSQEIYTDESPSKVYATGKGSSASINLLLVALLRAAGLNADPVILATRNTGIPHPIYPNYQKFNFVVAAVEIDNKVLFADATSKGLPLGYLSQSCLSLNGWRISETKSGWIALKSSAKSTLNTMIQLKKEGDQWIGKANIKEDGYRAAHALVDITQDGLSKYTTSKLVSLSDWVNGEAETQINLENNALTTEFKLTKDIESPDIIYFKPVLSGVVLDNPFKSETRNWPLDFPFTTNQSYALQMPLPEGYSISEIPKDLTLYFGEYKDVLFNYRCSFTENIITVTSKLTFKRNVFSIDEYPDFRLFYDAMAKKHQEMIVFKKS